MWPRMSHTLAPLTKLTYIKRKFKLSQFDQYAFDRIKQIVARDALLTYTDFSEAFKIHINASAFQLGGVISHKGKPISFYSIKLTGVQQQYTVTKR